MSLADDNFIQTNTGDSGASVASFNVTLPAGTTAGNCLIVIMQSTVAPTPPAGFSLIRSSTNTFAYVQEEADDAETSWTFGYTSNPNNSATWFIAEISNLDPVEPVETTAVTGDVVTGNGEQLATGTTALNAGLSTVTLAAFGVNTTAGGFADYTNGFEEIADVQGTHRALGVARLFTNGTTGTFQSTATIAAHTDTPSRTMILVLRAADSPIAAPLNAFLGFDWGTHGGATISQTAPTALFGGNRYPVGTWGTQYLIQAGSARASDYGLRITTTSSLAGIYFGNYTGKAGSVGANVRVVSATGTVQVMGFASATPASNAALWYNATTSKFGVSAGGGTIVYQDGTTATNTWVWVEMRVRFSGTTACRVEWRLETAADTYTEQPAFTGSVVNNTNVTAYLGAPTGTSQTATIDFDDAVVSSYWAAYPLHPHRVRLLAVDPSGTPSVTGTTGNFHIVTNAGSNTAAWNATDARNAVDEVPPDMGATADAVHQITAATGDYVTFPMASYTATSTEIIAGVRMLAACWDGTSGAGGGTMGVRGWNGTTETTFLDETFVYDAQSPSAGPSNIHPYWRCAMWPSGIGWTQAELNAAELRMGFSSDATPDKGVGGIYLEVAVRPTQTALVMEIEDNVFTVHVRLNPYNSASVSYLITNNDAVRSATFDYEVNGTPQTPVVCAPMDTEEVITNAATFEEITAISLTPEPSP